MTKIFSNLQDNTIHHFILSQEILNKDINYSPGKKKKERRKNKWFKKNKTERSMATKGTKSCQWNAF